jgi:hypothetical protein
MSNLHDLIGAEPVVANVGVEALADALRAQAVPVEHADWRPPVAGSEAALETLAASGRMEAANHEAITRMLAVRPQWVDIVAAGDVFPQLSERTLFHAGPPIDWQRASGPMRGAIIGAVLYEGWAETAEAAEELAAGGTIALAPCHEHGVVGPMAGIVSPSMPLFDVRDGVADAPTDRVAYVTLNEGLGKVLRYGSFDDEVIDRLRWIERVLGPVLKQAINRRGPIDLRAITAQALQMGDDGHNRHRAATSLLLRELGPALIAAAGDNADSESSADQREAVWRFIDGNDHFMLNLTMAAGKLGADAASGVEGSSMVVTMARNGTDFGIRLSGTGARWFTAPADVAQGLFLGDFTADDANPDLGDSSITETVGLGGFAMAAAPSMVRFVGGSVADALQNTLAMYAITLAEHPAYQAPILEFRGTPVGIDAALVARTGLAPVINTGIAGRIAGMGQVGAGIVRPPMQCFVDGLVALAAFVESND